jgi:hypothetical protein
MRMRRSAFPVDPVLVGVEDPACAEGWGGKDDPVRQSGQAPVDLLAGRASVRDRVADLAAPADLVVWVEGVAG